MSAQQIQSPSGLELHPTPPQPVRLSKRAGILFILIVGIVLSLLLFGLYSRQRRHGQPLLGPADDRSLVAATDAGRRIAQDVPAKSLGGPPGVSPDADSELQLPNATSPGRSRPGMPPAAAIKSVQHPAYEVVSQVKNPEPTAEERQLQLAYQRHQEAVAAPASVGQGFGGYGRPAVAPSSANDLSQITSLLQSLLRPGSGSGLPQASSPAGGDGGQNAKERKESFFANARRNGMNSPLMSRRMPARGLYEIKAGWDIPAILEQTVNSDLPGEIRALVGEDVYDTATGRWLLIPQGARLLGLYDSRIAYGQNAVQAVWNRLIYPDASSINLDGMVGQDVQGASGLRDDVDNHYRRLVGFGLLTSTFSAAFQLSQSRRNGVLGYPSPTETAGTAVGQQLSQLGADVTRRNLNVQPTIKVHAGYRFNVRVNRDIEFEAPYKPIAFGTKLP